MMVVRVDILRGDLCDDCVNAGVGGNGVAAVDSDEYVCDVYDCSWLLMLCKNSGYILVVIVGVLW